MPPGSKLTILRILIADFQESLLAHNPCLSLWRDSRSTRRQKEVWSITHFFTLAHLGVFPQAHVEPLLMSDVRSWSGLASVAWQFYLFQRKVVLLSSVATFLIVSLSLRLLITHLFSWGKVTVGDWFSIVWYCKFSHRANMFHSLGIHSLLSERLSSLHTTLGHLFPHY